MPNEILYKRSVALIYHSFDRGREKTFEEDVAKQSTL